MTLFTVLSTAVSTGFSTIVFGAHCVTSDPGWETDTAPAQMFEASSYTVVATACVFESSVSFVAKKIN